MGQESSEKVKVVVHQPQFLPWAGAWFRYISADVYVVYAGVKFNKEGHQHRVTLNGRWVTLPIDHKTKTGLIKDVRLSDLSHLMKISKTIRQSLMNKKCPYGDRLAPVVSILENWRGPFMLDLTHELFVCMADILGVKKKIIVDMIDRSVYERSVKLQQCLNLWCPYDKVIYLTGGGSKNYMGFDSLGGPVVETRFQKVLPGTNPDSFLQSIALKRHPLEDVKYCSVWETRGRKELAWDE